MKKIYVGNLPFSATEDEITQMFGEHGTVHSVALINDPTLVPLMAPLGIDAYINPRATTVSSILRRCSIFAPAGSARRRRGVS